MASIENKVEELLINTINELGYELYDIEYTKEGKEYFLRIFIDKKDGIDLNDCEKVSNKINDMLDKANFINEQYFLEVSSPGIERFLRKDKHFKDNIGLLVEAKLFRPIQNEKRIQGILKDFSDDYVLIEVEKSDIKIDRKNISIIKTIYEW